jgi:hypothetical protein
MKRMFISFTNIILLTGVLLYTGCAGGSEPEQELNEQGYWEISKSGITLQWKVDGSDLDVILSAPTTGWVAVGFDPSSRMQGANIILGKVETGTPIVRDDFGSAPTDHTEDVITNVTVNGGTEVDGITTVSFSIPLDSGDSNDKPLAEGESYRVLLSYGSSDDFDQKHSTRTSVSITI